MALSHDEVRSCRESCRWCDRYQVSSPAHSWMVSSACSMVDLDGECSHAHVGMSHVCSCHVPGTRGLEVLRPTNDIVRKDARVRRLALGPSFSRMKKKSACIHDTACTKTENRSSSELNTLKNTTTYTGQICTKAVRYARAAFVLTVPYAVQASCPIAAQYGTPVGSARRA